MPKRAQRLSLGGSWTVCARLCGVAKEGRKGPRLGSSLSAQNFQKPLKKEHTLNLETLHGLRALHLMKGYWNLGRRAWLRPVLRREMPSIVTIVSGAPDFPNHRVRLLGVEFLGACNPCLRNCHYDVVTPASHGPASQVVPHDALIRRNPPDTSQLEKQIPCTGVLQACLTHNELSTFQGDKDVGQRVHLGNCPMSR